TDGDVVGVPLADVSIGILRRRRRRTHSGRHFLVHSIAVDFTGPDGPAPDIHLRLARAAQENPGIGIRHGYADLLSIGVFLVRAVVFDDRDVRVDVRRRLDAPVDVQREIAVRTFGPQTLVSRGR